jgi:ABC-2 type transport system ATP-binding protein
MDSTVVSLSEITKRFRVPRAAGKGLAERLGGALRPRVEEVIAVDGISFTIQRGERVAFIGPNGAGKSTTLKILAGILHADGGRAVVLGLSPFEDRHALGFRVGTVFGQRSQLWYQLPARDSFELFRHVYELPRDRFEERLRALVGTFDLEPLLEKPVRQLSLGERMRCEIAASLIHRPQILFLDEPTIGLDVSGKAAIREHLRSQSERDGVTLLLTSHDTGDIERVCERVIVIHRGRLVMDGPLSRLRQNHLGKRRVVVVTEASEVQLDLPGVQCVNHAPYRTTFDIEVALTPLGRVVDSVSQQTTLRDLEILDPPLDEVIRDLYASADREAPS